MQEVIKRQEKANKAYELAMTLYPHEKWEVLEAGIFIAKNRMPRSAEQINVLEKELRQARVLADRGSTVYFAQNGEFHQWTEDELGQKNPGLATRRQSGESRIYRNAPIIQLSWVFGSMSSYFCRNFWQKDVYRIVSLTKRMVYGFLTHR
jgi:hypothetical protein